MICAIRADPKNVPVITRIPIRIIFHPCFKKDLIWSLMEIPANAPTIVSGAVKLILLTASMTPSLTGEIGQATKRPKIEQYAIIGSFNGTSLLITTATREMARRIRIPGSESIKFTSNPTKFARPIPRPATTNMTAHSIYLIYASSTFSSFLINTSLGSCLNLANFGSIQVYNFLQRGIPTKIAT